MLIYKHPLHLPQFGVVRLQSTSSNLPEQAQCVGVTHISATHINLSSIVDNQLCEQKSMQGAWTIIVTWCTTYPTHLVLRCICSIEKVNCRGPQIRLCAIIAEHCQAAHVCHAQS